MTDETVKIDETVNMNVIKRNGQIEELSYNKIIHRLRQLMPETSIQYQIDQD